jgi:hypothetical protein
MPSAITLPHPESPRLSPHRLAELGLRLRVAASRAALDHQLAQGCRPETPALMLRSRQLVSARAREQVARGIERAIARARQKPSAAPSAAIPLQRAEIRQAAGRLEELAEELRSCRPVSGRGVAQASELLTDGTGPVFAFHPPGTLARRASAIMLTLRSVT